MSTTIPARTGTASRIELSEVEQFLYAEARFADDRRYDEWEALWADEALYWVPAGPESVTNPDKSISIIYDNRSRIALRVAQLKTGKRHSQDPASNVVHLICNVEITGRDEHGVETRAAFVAVESRIRGLTTWAGSVRHRLTTVDGRLRMSRKTVLLVNREHPVPTMSFLI